MLLTEMTSPEIAALPRDIVVVYPVASCEQRQWPIMAAPTRHPHPTRRLIDAGCCC